MSKALTKMAAQWGGFTQDDINKLKNHTGSNSATTIDVSTTRAVNSLGDKKKGQWVKRAAPVSQVSDKDVGIPAAARLSKLKEETAFGKDIGNELHQVPSLDNCSCEDNSESVINESQHEKNTSTADSNKIGNGRSKSLTAALMTPSLSEPPPTSINFSEFQLKQKHMEEQNRLRKVFLAKALEDRKKQTHAEQQRLAKIQEELQKLDQRLSTDVSIIRNQIEAASLEFMEAQKRYDRAEKEFLDAKLLLYTKLERKELLTHHLCTIIEQNEMRKAQKLSELMEKLNMPDSDPSPMKESSPSQDHNMINQDPDKKRKVSSEIILTPASVESASHFEGTKDDSVTVKHSESKVQDHMISRGDIKT